MGGGDWLEGWLAWSLVKVCVGWKGRLDCDDNVWDNRDMYKP